MVESVYYVCVYCVYVCIFIMCSQNCFYFDGDIGCVPVFTGTTECPPFNIAITCSSNHFTQKPTSQNLSKSFGTPKKNIICFLLTLNKMGTPSFKYDKTIKDKEIDEIVNELKDIMIMKIKMRRNGMVLSP